MDGTTPTNPETVGGDHIYTFNVSMSCGGCSGAIERVLGKMEGIKSYKVDLDTQTARVTTAQEQGASYEDVLEKIKKTGKKVSKGDVDGVERGV